MTMKLYGLTTERKAHKHAKCGHFCYCAGLKNPECQRCSRTRWNREQAAAYAARQAAAK